uniref:Cytochrome P450 2J6-like n=1 Tax=Saccoglossus kowalevskii TaxID=10224 RepID=A0ABM0M1M1_SACKO|nr:PREDICTED: cytochrome P450 2J6-like [Saccoglossus kowalevskii]
MTARAVPPNRIATIGPSYFVILNGIDGIREALVERGDDCAGRPEMFIKSFGAGGKGIITHSFDSDLQEQKKFALRSLKCFGLEGASMEARIKRESISLAELLLEKAGEAIGMARYLQLGTSNVICSVTFGERFDYNSGQFQFLLDQLDEQFYTNPFKYLLQIARIIPKPLRKRMSWMDLASPAEKVLGYLSKVIEEHHTKFNPDCLLDIIDAFLLKQEQHKAGYFENRGESAKSFNNEQLKYLLLDFFLAGTETTATTLNWALLFMIRFPRVQDKVQEELDMLLGKDPNAVASMSDRRSLPYTSATLLEIQRIRPVAPMGTPHSTIRDTCLHGYELPKGTPIITNLWSVHHDEKYWPNPEEFVPSRMLDEDGIIIRPYSFLPFAIGPRACLGEQLAKLELFIFFTTLMHRFSFSSLQGQPMPSLEPHLGISMTPKPYKLCITQRL